MAPLKAAPCLLLQGPVRSQLVSGQMGHPWAGELLAEMNLPETVSGREPLLKLAMELTETVLDTAVRSLVYIILYLLLISPFLLFV